MPPGVLALMHNDVTYPAASRVLGRESITRFVLDQDAGQRAGVINSPGRLYYLLLKR
jgi:membrane-bound lytic murein transglycosylase A